MYYDVYLPWYLNKETYFINKKKNEKKYNCIIKEKKFNSIFPLKKVIGHLVVANKKRIIVNLFFERQYWKMKHLIKKKIFLKSWKY